MNNLKKIVTIMGLSSAAAVASAVSFEAGLELGNTNLNRNNLDWYAPYQTGAPFTGIIGQGDSEQLEPSSDQTVSLMFGVDLGNSWTVSLGFSSVEFSEEDSVTTPFEASAQRVHADWGDVADGDWDFGTGEFTLDEQAINLEVAYKVTFGDGGKGTFSPLAGLRLLTIEQTFDTLYADTTATNGTTVAETLDSDGTGFFAGAEVTWKFNELFGAEGRIELGALQVDTSRENLETINIGTATPDVYVDTGDSFSESATTVAARLGLFVQALESDNVNLIVHAGYEFSSVNGLSDFINFPDDVVDGKTSRNMQSLGKDGLYLGLTGTF